MEVTRFQKKLTDEAATYAVMQLAKDVPVKQITQEINEYFDIKITAVRISKLTQTVRWELIYNEARKVFLASIRDFTGIAIAAQRDRLQAGDKLNKRLQKFMDKIESRINTNEEYHQKMYKLIDSLPELIGDTKAMEKVRKELLDIDIQIDQGNELALIKELRALIETSIKALNYGRSETEQKARKQPDTPLGISQFNDFMKKVHSVKVVNAEVVGDKNGQSEKEI